MISEFRVRVPGKWVLMGEHAVLRGATAVAFPYMEVHLSLTYRSIPQQGSLVVKPSHIEPLIQDLLGFVRKSNLSFWPLHGELNIESTIPMGAGLGSSAALCVALTRWLEHAASLSLQRRDQFATELENYFHGQSSGMDIAVILAEQPIAFRREQGARELNLQNLPRFTLHDTGLRARTRDCIGQVQALVARDSQKARDLDEAMGMAALATIRGLELYSEGQKNIGLQILSESLRRGAECFEEWGLVPSQVLSLKSELEKQGALAVKLTGAGGGGMLVALWG